MTPVIPVSAIERVDSAATDALDSVDFLGDRSTRQVVRLLEFGAVGASGAVVNLLVFLAITPRITYLAAGFAAFFSGVLWTFGLNWAVTFRHVTDRVGRRFVRYIGVCCIGYVIYSATLAGTINIFALPYWAAGLSAVSTAGVWNFLGSERYALA